MTMNDFTDKESRLLYNHLNRFLKHFDSNALEEKFWNDTYNIKDLKALRSKLSLSLEKNA